MDKLYKWTEEDKEKLIRAEYEVARLKRKKRMIENINKRQQSSYNFKFKLKDNLRSTL